MKVAGLFIVENSSVVVTGGASRIGRGHAEALAVNGVSGPFSTFMRSVAKEKRFKLSILQIPSEKHTTINSQRH